MLSPHDKEAPILSEVHPQVQVHDASLAQLPNAADI